MSNEIKIKEITLVYPAFFKKRKNPFSEELRYEAAFSYEGDELTEIGAIRKGEQELYNTGSKIQTALRPKISNFKQFQKLTEVLHIAKTCNFPLDKLLQNMVVDATVFYYNYEYAKRSGTGLCLTEIRICPEELKAKILEQE